MRGTPAQIGFINGVTGYILRCKKGIYTDKGMKSFFGQPYLKIINIRGTHAQICFRKRVSKVMRSCCFCDLHHNVKYFFCLSVIGSLENNLTLFVFVQVS